MNLWHFRKEMWRFRGYDYGFNLSLFSRSLELTAKFMRSDKTVSDNCIEAAGQIDIFLALLEDHKRHLELAEKELGVSIFSSNKEEVNKIASLSQRIEEDRWEKALDFLKNNMRNWWD